MDIVTNATRISPYDFDHETGKESSSPLVTTNQNPNESQSPIQLKRFNQRIRMRRESKQEREPRILKEPKFGKQHESISNSEKFHLCLQFMANNIIMRQISGNIVNRLKGKITEIEYMFNVGQMEERKTRFFLESEEFIRSKKEEIDSGYLEPHTFDIITDALARIPLKEKNANQREKLKVKIMTQFASQTIYVTSSDPLIALKLQLMELSPDQRIKVLGAIPL